MIVLDRDTASSIQEFVMGHPIQTKKVKGKKVSHHVAHKPSDECAATGPETIGDLPHPL
ncbi:MAG: hypothetical protein ACI8S6_004563, partial [Myxococcota bacterium]